MYFFNLIVKLGIVKVFKAISSQNRGSYMSVHVLLNLLNELGKRDKMRGLYILSLCTEHCYGRHNVSRKSVNHQWFIDFIAWRYFTPRRNVI